MCRPRPASDPHKIRPGIHNAFVYKPAPEREVTSTSAFVCAIAMAFSPSQFSTNLPRHYGLRNRSLEAGDGSLFFYTPKIFSCTDLPNSHQNSHSPEIETAADLAASHLADFAVIFGSSGRTRTYNPSVNSWKFALFSIAQDCSMLFIPGGLKHAGAAR